MERELPAGDKKGLKMAFSLTLSTSDFHLAIMNHPAN